jgi:signal transduction protein with GAF and PtsI domain
LSTVLNVAIKETAHALNADASWCYLFKDNVLTLSAHHGLSKNYLTHMEHLKPGNGAEGMAFSRNESVFRDGLLFHSGKARTVVKDEGLRTIAAIPLQNRNIIFGSLAIGTRRTEAWTPRDERMLLSIGRQVAQAIANSQLFSDATEKAQSWETNYAHLQKTNEDLSNRNEALEQHIRELHQAQRQIWTALAASNEARRQLTGAQAEQQLRDTLQRILGKLGEDENNQAGSTPENNAAK